MRTTKTNEPPHVRRERDREGHQRDDERELAHAAARCGPRAREEKAMGRLMIAAALVALGCDAATETTRFRTCIQELASSCVARAAPEVCNSDRYVESFWELCELVVVARPPQDRRPRAISATKIE